jgi:hypothetical protein
MLIIPTWAMLHVLFSACQKLQYLYWLSAANAAFSGANASVRAATNATAAVTNFFIEELHEVV